MSTDWAGYRSNFVSLLRHAARLGVTDVVFGDIDIESHRQWEEDVCGAVGVKARLPIWQESRHKLLREWWSLGFTAFIVAVNAKALDRSFLGKELDTSLAQEFRRLGIDVCGENGEFHTVVTDGPLFSQRLELNHGEQTLRDGYWFQDFTLGDG